MSAREMFEKTYNNEIIVKFTSKDNILIEKYILTDETGIYLLTKENFKIKEKIKLVSWEE